jgi:hypothetical protein
VGFSLRPVGAERREVSLEVALGPLAFGEAEIEERLRSATEGSEASPVNPETEFSLRERSVAIYN